MDTVLGSALKQALDAKKNDYSNFVWKGEKKKVGDTFVQDTKKLIDMDSDELNHCYEHCMKMLYNQNPKNPGRLVVLKDVTEQINKCNTELLLRYYENNYLRNEMRNPIKRAPTLMMSLRELMANNPEITDWRKVPVTKITDDLPAEFHTISVNDILNGCIDCLGVFDKRHLTITFITKMGLWFTKAEESELKGEHNSNAERLKIAKERLRIPSYIDLSFNEKGLSFHEMRAILTLQKKTKYSDMTTEQLITLRNKILHRFQMEVDKHIYNWKKLIKQIELVAKEKGFELNEVE